MAAPLGQQSPRPILTFAEPGADVGEKRWELQQQARWFAVGWLPRMLVTARHRRQEPFNRE
jgi:hypothetical protein